MSTKIVGRALVALTIVGCGSPSVAPPARPPEPITSPPGRPLTVEAVFSACGAYKTVAPSAFGLCVKELAGGVTLSDLDRLCAAAGSWSDACHSAWVEVHAKGRRASPDELYAGCGAVADCQLQQVDAHPQADVLRQLERCAGIVGPMAHDCAGHGLQRWARAHPDAADVGRVVAATDGFASERGTFVGMVAACQGGAACPEGEGELARACGAAVRTYATDPARCGVGERLR